MKEIQFFNSRGKILSGRLYSVESDRIIIMAHGFTSDQNSRGRFPMLAAAFNQSGFDAMTFDFSGCGMSSDETINASKQEDDLRSAIALAKNSGYKKLALYGHSLGSLICLRCCNDTNIETAVVSGALTGPMHYDWTEHFTTEQLEELESTGFLTETKSNGSRGRVVIEKQMLNDFSEIDQKKLLESLKCPVLIIHGTEGKEELSLYQHSRYGLKYLPAGSSIKVIEGASHSFMDHLDELINAALQWLMVKFTE